MREGWMVGAALAAWLGLAGLVRADPISGAVAASAAWLTGGLAAVGITGAFATAVMQLGGALILGKVTQALTPRPKQAELVRALQQPSSLPPYRFAYGAGWVPGTPAPLRVKGGILYGCWILNSRPSAGPFTLYLDKRAVVAAGDPYDFAAGGAVASNSPFGSGRVKYWIGRGDQLGPPAQILAEAPEYFMPSDGWRGLTVIWMRLDVGPNKTRSERWPSTPPEVMVDGRWSLLWDPRQPEAAPAWSANQALCVLDALRMNPLRKYDDRNLWLETFAWAADVADQRVATRAGGTIARYQANGVLVFSPGAEIEDQLQPLADAGASVFTRVGGRLGLVPGIWRPPVMTLRDVLADQPMAFRRYRPSSDLVTEVSATYVSPARAYEDAATPALVLPGAQAEDGGQAKPREYDLRMITDHRQAQRVAKILGLRSRMQRALTAVFPPAAFDLVGGSVVALDFPAPYRGRNGLYEVEEAHPGLDPLGRDGVALRCALVLREISPEVYAWDAAREEQEVLIEAWDPSIGALPPPDSLALTSGAETLLTGGDSQAARVRFAFAPAASSRVTSYEWQFRRGGDAWQSGGLIDADIRDGAGAVFGYLVPVQLGQPYTVRVASIAPGMASDWLVSDPVIASAGSYLAPAPVPLSALGEAGQIRIRVQAPNHPDYRALEIWGAGVDNPGAAMLIFGPIYGAANAVFEAVETGLGPGASRFYFARSIDRNGAPSPFSAGIGATTSAA